jgi:hypothetical protein
MIRTPNGLNKRLEDVLGVGPANEMLNVIEQNALSKDHFYEVLSFALVGQLEKYKPLQGSYSTKVMQEEFRFPERVDPNQLYLKVD